MSLNILGGKLSMVMRPYFVLALVMLFVLAGCESSEQTMKQTDDQALSSFVGDKKPEAPPPVDQEKLTQLESENTGLKQKLAEVERDNGALNTRISDLETKIAATAQAVEPSKSEPPMTLSVSNTDPMSEYEASLKAFNSKNYDDAIKIYESLLAGGVSDELADNCHYWMGESYFGKKDFKQALSHFETVLNYKASEKRGDAVYMMGRCYERMGNKAKAKEMYEKVAKDYPTSDRVKKAKQKSGK